MFETKNEMINRNPLENLDLDKLLEQRVGQFGRLVFIILVTNKYIFSLCFENLGQTLNVLRPFGGLVV